ncbi:MAG: hypothetical protein K2N58_10300 [Treponemataceae bacterium]|nr:hypothetical protein [Treponemataceae bacterium]
MKKHFKKLVLVLAVTLAGAMVSAWDWTSYCENLDGSHWLIKAGVGYGYSWWNGGFVIPIQGEYLLDAIPLGITANFRPIFSGYGAGFSLIAGANYHVAPGPEWLDLYAGLGLGFFFDHIADKYVYHGDKQNWAHFAFDAHIGASFMFSKHFGVNVEAGYPTYFSASAALAF